LTIKLYKSYSAFFYIAIILFFDMSLTRNILIVILAWALLGAANALAMSHDHGDHQLHQNAIVSPFDGKKEVRSMHCLLRGHSHQGFCPHSKSERSQTDTIASDCGGKTTPSIPNTTSFSNDFGIAVFVLRSHYSPDEKLTPIVFKSYHNFIDSLDPPPRIL
jgi:hypothetical protein